MLYTRVEWQDLRVDMRTFSVRIMHTLIRDFLRVLHLSSYEHRNF